MSLFAELKRRNVFRVGLFYIVSAWLIVQVAETLLPIFDVPDDALRAIVLILALGFVPALVFAWAFELTPDGLKRDKDAQVDPATKQKTSQKLNWATLIAAVLAIGVVVADRIMPQPSGAEDEATLAAPSTAGTEPPAVETSSAVEDDPRVSIAVLAFENMSTDAENEFFAEGISEEILNALAGIEGLKVASRTSAFSLSGRDTPIPEIARQLDVEHVLEGSVRKAGNRVRITAQLIDAGDDAHLWSEVYDRELDDIFAVQEEIARAITAALTGLLQTGTVAIAAPTDNLEAYEIFLRARSRFYQRVELDTAIAELRRAVELDSDFGPAWAFLAASEYVVGSGSYPTELDKDGLLVRARSSAERALALAASHPVAQAVRGSILIESGGAEGIDEGLRTLEAAAAEVSPDSTPRLWLGIQYLQLGKPQRALDVLELAVEQDPLVAINNGYYGVALLMLGEQEQGRRYAMRSVELSRSLMFWVNLMATDAANAGDPDTALELLTEARSMVETDDRFTSALIEALTDGIDYKTFQDRYTGIFAPNLQPVADTISALLLGEIDQALEQASVPVDGAGYSIINSAWLPSMNALREHPGFFAWTSDLGFVDYWRVHGFPLDCRPIVEDGVERLDCGGVD